MSDYTFKTDNTENRVKLDPVFIKRAIASTSNSHVKRRKHKSWTAEEVMKACELYVSGFRPQEISDVIDRPYITVNGKLNNVFGRRSGVWKMRNPAAVLHQENRTRSIVGEELMTWEQIDNK